MPARSASGVGLETDRRGRQKSQPLHQSFGAEGSAFEDVQISLFQIVSFGSEILGWFHEGH